jgi:outer membrane protein assembly factor BamB
MSFYDISGKIELITSSNPKEITDWLVSSFQSMKIKATQENNVISFNIPFLKSVTRGYVFQGITSGVVDVEQTNINQLTLEYKLITIPIRVFVITMVLWITLGIPFISDYLVEGSNFQGYPTFAFTALAMFSAVILASRFIIKYKFSSFLKKTLVRKYSEIRQPAWKNQIDVKRVVIVSCLGVLSLALLVPVVLFFGIWNIRAKVVWEYPMQGAVMSPPLIAGHTIYFGSLGDAGQSAFYALEKETGKEIWIEPLDGGLSSSPILANDMVCFGADDGIFRCRDQENGIVRWDFSPAQRNLDANECSSCALKLNSPLFDGNTIYVGSHDHNLYALDSQSGQLLWSFPANGSVFDAPALENGILYVGSQDGNIYALDTRSGKEIRHYSVPSMNEAGEESGVYATPIIDANTIYAVNGTLTAVDMETGTIKWQVLGSSMYEDQITSTPILFGDSIIVSTIEKIYGVDKSSGNIKWKYSGIKGGIFFTPTLYKDVIYFGDSNGYLYGVNAGTGRQSFRYNMNYLDFTSYTNFFQDFTFPPATDGEMIYVKWLNHFYGIQHKNQ